MTPTGRLVLVATPIGNLGDITPRAVEALRSADIVACEDTRRTGGLLSHLGISSPRKVVVNEHTESAAAVHLVDAMRAGKIVALVSDAGTPGVSDPGERLVAAAVAAGISVTSTPGVSAAVMALSISGLPSGRWVFEGFLPRSGSGRTERLQTVATEPRTVVLYESPHRVARTLADLATACGGDRHVVLARELTKMHEEVWRGTLDEANVMLANREPLGEYVLVLDGAPAVGPVTDEQILHALTAALAAGEDRKAAIAGVMEDLGAAKRRVYDLALSLKP
jgi:16S rRNA (cytidine1402-2'-O)-methyltransferase